MTQQAADLGRFKVPSLRNVALRAPYFHSGGVPPRSSAVPPAYVGNPAFTLGVDRTAPGAFPLLVFDFAANASPTTVLGHSVYLAQTAAMTSVAGQGLTAGAGAGGGFGSFTFALPNDPGLRGVSLFGQWLIVDAQGPAGFASSNAFGLTIF